MINVLSLFSGIGAFESALEHINEPYNIINFCEIDKYAPLCYSKMHNVDINKNLGDITKIDLSIFDEYENIDLLTHGSPCQDFSVSGKGRGGDENSGTRSSLMWYSIKIIDKIRPKVVIWENVKNVLSSKHIHNFEKYINTMKDMGYKNTWKIVDAVNYGLPQHRERIFVVSIREDESTKINMENIFNHINYKKTTIKNYLEYPNIKDVPKEFYCNRPLKHTNKPNRGSDTIIEVGVVKEKSQAGKVYSINGIFPTICACTHGYALGYIYQDQVIRTLTPCETFLIMGFTRKDYEVCKNLNISKTQMYKMTGNSICVPILENIFKNIIQIFYN